MWVSAQSLNPPLVASLLKSEITERDRGVKDTLSVNHYSGVIRGIYKLKGQFIYLFHNSLCTTSEPPGPVYGLRDTTSETRGARGAEMREETLQEPGHPPCRAGFIRGHGRAAGMGQTLPLWHFSSGASALQRRAGGRDPTQRRPDGKLQDTFKQDDGGQHKAVALRTGQSRLPVRRPRQGQVGHYV